MVRQRFNAALLFVLLLTLVAACSKGGGGSSPSSGSGGGGGSSGGGGTTNDAVGTWVGSYLNIQLNFRSDMTGDSSRAGYVTTFSYLVNGNNVTWTEQDAFFYCWYTNSYGIDKMITASNASGTISGTSMTVTFKTSVSDPCTASGTVTVTKQ